MERVFPHLLSRYYTASLKEDSSQHDLAWTCSDSEEAQSSWLAWELIDSVILKTDGITLYHNLLSWKEILSQELYTSKLEPSG